MPTFITYILDRIILYYNRISKRDLSISVWSNKDKIKERKFLLTDLYDMCQNSITLLICDGTKKTNQRINYEVMGKRIFFFFFVTLTKIIMDN